MPDQAEHLRNLVQAAPAIAQAAPGGAPLVVVTGCRAGVGATTVAVNVGAVLADRGSRVLVVDATGERSNMMEIAGVRSAAAFTLADALAGKCDVADAVVAGPAGVKFLAARGWASAKKESAPRTSTCSPRQARGLGLSKAAVAKAAATGRNELLTALKSLRGAFDVLVIDAGTGLSRTSRRLWLRAQLVLLVTTSDDAAVMDAYAAMKRHMVGARDATCENIRLLVNQADSDRAAAGAQRRLANCCQRFLRQSVTAAPALPLWDDGEATGAGRHPRMWEAQNSEFGHAVLWLGRAIRDVLKVDDSTNAEFAGIQHRRSI